VILVALGLPSLPSHRECLHARLLVKTADLFFLSCQRLKPPLQMFPISIDGRVLAAAIPLPGFYLRLIQHQAATRFLPLV
jgi:hypothetical protein